MGIELVLLGFTDGFLPVLEVHPSLIEGTKVNQVDDARLEKLR